MGSTDERRRGRLGKCVRNGYIVTEHAANKRESGADKRRPSIRLWFLARRGGRSGYYALINYVFVKTITFHIWQRCRKLSVKVTFLGWAPYSWILGDVFGSNGTGVLSAAEGLLKVSTRTGTLAFPNLANRLRRRKRAKFGFIDSDK
uniref:Transmembrane protein n=1 Tax=Steinernema glaseri TaxID=37863 RepID=A0A1I7YY61_9BILA